MGNKNFNIETNKSSKKSLIVFALILGLIIFLTFFNLSFNEKEIAEKNILNRERYLRIIDIFRVKKEHNYIYIKLSGGEISKYNNLYKVGDSLSKKKGDSIEYIFRGDSIIQNNLFELYRRENMMK